MDGAGLGLTAEVGWGWGWTGLDWAGRGGAGLGWAGLGWARMGWAEVGWPALDWTGLGWTGPSQAHSPVLGSSLTLSRGTAPLSAGRCTRLGREVSTIVCGLSTDWPADICRHTQRHHRSPSVGLTGAGQLDRSRPGGGHGPGH